MHHSSDKYTVNVKKGRVHPKYKISGVTSR